VTFAGLVALYLGAAAVLALISEPIKTETSGPHEVRLLSGPIHVDLLLPLTPEVRARFGWLGDHGLAIHARDAAWLSVGWGAREFYTHTGTYADLSARPVVKAVFGDRSVLRFDLVGPFPADLARNIPVNDATLSALSDNILQTLTNGAETRPINGAALTGTDRFFPATGRFHILRTCNVWLGQTLRAAGIRFGLWTPTPYAVRLSHARFVDVGG